jgi:hypothetical protein
MEMKTTDKRLATRSIGMVIALATAALSAGKASAQEAVRELVSVSDIEGVVSSRMLENGDLELTLENGRTVTIVAADVVTQNGVVLVEASALAQVGLAAEVAAAGGPTLLIGGIGALAVGGIAIAAGAGEPNNAPAITSAATATTPENTSAAVYTATASDIDGNAITFSIVGGADAARFAINSRTGALTFIAGPNFEAPNDANTDNRYEVIIGASDGKVTVQQPIVVTVTNVNDVAPVITSLAAVSAAENRTTTFTATATDAEGDTVTFTLSGADAGLFNINATTGVVTFKVAPDFEAPADAGANNVYDVVVTASDGRNSATQNVAVTVTNAVNITGTANADTLTGTAAIEELSGLGGNDRLDAAGGSDTVTTGLGSDTIVYQGNAFDGADVSATGRQIIGNEDFITDFNFATPLTTISVASASTTPAVLTAALAGRIYFNVHSTAFPSGEVRGQAALVSDNRAPDGTGTVTFNSVLNGANEVATPPVVTNTTGVATITFTVAANGTVTYATQIDLRDFDVARLTVGHLHEAPVGSNGPVVLDIVGNARTNGSIAGSVEADRYEFDASDYGVTTALSFVSLDANATGAGIPAGANVIVLRNSDNDANPATPFVAGTALAQVAALVNTDGPGFIVYYNSVLQQNRVLYSANLNDVTADVKVVSRHSDLTGQAAIDALAKFTANNFDLRGDVFVGTAAVDTLNGTAASDRFTGLAGADTITTGAGRDTVTFDATSLGSAPDTLSDFDVAQDRFLLDAAGFNVTGPLKVQNALAANIVNNGSNVIILRDSDNDADPATVFNARSAAQLIGTAVNADGAGFFVYFNSALNLNRLVYSTNLNDGAAPLTVLGAVGTTTGQAAIDQLALYGSSNFAFGSSAPVSTLAEAPTSRLLTVGEVADLNVASPSGAFSISGSTETNGFGFEHLGFGARDVAIADAQTLDDVAGMNLLPDVPVIASIEGF